jgi:hypothetical protein
MNWIFKHKRSLFQTGAVEGTRRSNFKYERRSPYAFIMKKSLFEKENFDF